MASLPVAQLAELGERQTLPSLLALNHAILANKSAFIRQDQVFREPESEWVARMHQALLENDDPPLVIDPASKNAFDFGSAQNAFTGLVDTAQKTIYLFPLVADPRYGNTSYPDPTAPLPDRASQRTHAPLAHLNTAGSPSHQQFAALLGSVNQGTFLGFAVIKQTDGTGQVSTTTSRSQNKEIFFRKQIRGNVQDQIAAKGNSNAGISSEVISENWADLIIKSIVITLTGDRLFID